MRFKIFTENGTDLIGVNTDNEIWSIGGNGTAESDFEWSFISGEIGIDSFNYNHITKLMIRIQANKGTRIKVSSQYDGGDYIHCFSGTACNAKAFLVPIIARRCNSMRYKIDGIGDAKILGIAVYTERGSEVNV